MINAILSLITFPIIILNTFGIVVAFIWLTALGHFKEAALGVVAAVFAGLFIWIALLPATFVQLPAMWAINRGKYFLAVVLAIPGNIWTVMVMTFYAHEVLFHTIYDSPPNEPLLPYSLLGYSVATSPWLYAATKDGNDGSGAVLTYFLCAGCALVIGIVEFVNHPFISTLTLTLVGTMTVAFIFTTLASVFVAGHQAASNKFR